MTKNPEEIMTEHLLTGGKMLKERCQVCGAPLFEIKGVKQCVVCAEAGKNKENSENKKPNVENNSNICVIEPKYSSNKSDFSPNQLTKSIDEVIMMFLEKAKTETDSARCLTLMECVRTAAEAKTILARF